MSLRAAQQLPGLPGRSSQEQARLASDNKRVFRLVASCGAFRENPEIPCVGATQWSADPWFDFEYHACVFLSLQGRNSNASGAGKMYAVHRVLDGFVRVSSVGFCPHMWRLRGQASFFCFMEGVLQHGVEDARALASASLVLLRVLAQVTLDVGFTDEQLGCC